jgi:SAM-dependent methyltransferase
MMATPPPMTVHGWLRFDVLERLMPDRVDSVLEIGAGVGAVGSLLAARYRYVGLEPDPESYEAARRQVGSKGTVLCVREEDYDTGERFDLVCAFEVLEHIEDDVAALRRWRRRTATDGSLIVSVPAGRDRFGSSDARQGHVRRYDRDDLVAALTGAGFVDVQALVYGFPIGYLLHAVSHARARRESHASTLDARTASSGRWMQPSRGTGRRLVAKPFAYLQRPFSNTQLGTGLVARARVDS